MLFAVIKKELLAMSRDVHGLLVLFVMPAAFILVMSLALRDTFQPSVSDKLRWQAWDGEHSAESAAFLKRLPPVASEVKIEARDDVERALAAGRIQAGVLIDAGFAKAIADEKNTRALVTVLAEPGTPPPVIGAFRMEVTKALTVARVSAVMKELTEGEADAPKIDLNALTEGAKLDFVYRGQAGVGLTAVQQSVPAWLVFAMFFVVIPLSTIFIAEKQLGTFPRLRSLQVPVGVLLAGKVLPFYVVNLAQTGLMLVVGRYVVPLLGGDALRLDVDWLALGAMASAVSLAAIGFALVVAAVARTNEQATTVGGVANILFGALGGVMVPKLMMPLAMQHATWASPMAWGLDGFLNVFVRGAHIGDILTSLGLLLGFAALCLALAWRRLRDSV